MQFTKEQYQTLVKMIYLANWMIEEEEEDYDPNNEFSRLEQHVLSHAKEFGFDANVVFDEDSKLNYLAEEYEEQSGIFDVIENYDDALFYSRLAGHFASIEMEKFSGLSDDAFEEKEAELSEKYMKILADKGMDAIELKK